jgi:hypothetical protein
VTALHATGKSSRAVTQFYPAQQRVGSALESVIAGSTLPPPQFGPESLPGRLYAQFPSVFHALSGRRWLDFTRGLERIDFLRAFPSLALQNDNGAVRQAIADVHHFVRVLFAFPLESIVGMVLPCHLPYFQKLLVEVLHFPVNRLIVDASNIVSAIRHLGLGLLCCVGEKN